MQYLGILEKYQDIAGKWVVRVDLDGESAFFKFPTDPTEAAVIQRANEYIAQWEESQQQQQEQSAFLDQLETMYVSFLETTWTNVLRQNNLISESTTIDLSVTANENVQYLMQLRTLDFATYDQMADEFLRFRGMIEENGGDLGNIQVS